MDASTPGPAAHRRRTVLVGCALFAALMLALLSLLPGVPADAVVVGYAVQDDPGTIVVAYQRPAGEELRRLYVEETGTSVTVRAVLSTPPWRPWTQAPDAPALLDSALITLRAPLDGRDVVGLDGALVPQEPRAVLLDSLAPG